MTELVIKGGNTLTGEIEIGGAKNSVVALMPAAILGSKVEIKKIPNISDVANLKEILKYLGVSLTEKKDSLLLDMQNIENKVFDENIANKLRASYYFMGAFLSKFGKCEIYHPGGCVIGERPVDIHLEGFKALGAIVEEYENKYILRGENLKGTEINLKFPSVGATINIMLAAVKAKGITKINNVALEPEIDNVIDLLNSMGAKINRENNSIIIDGVENLSEGTVNVIPDRIEAGTYIIAGLLVGNRLKIKNIIPSHLTSLFDVLSKMGADFKLHDDYVIVSKANDLKAVDIITEPYPGFPTDLQQPLTPLLTMANGVSHITENIYENRFKNVKYLNEMGANIKINDKTLTITGPTKLIGCNVASTDLRAGACLVIAGLASSGVTKISSIEYIIRGYEHITDKLTKANGDIKII